ncbi:MAG: beta-propeller domain-containing protein, partial [Solirubrobacteraceae bacterium]|nr:beta-propeller domain-containing protein [Solirubrobacteraceae bacterium]
LNTPPELDFGSTEPAPAPGVAPPAVAAAKRPGLRAFVPETILRSRITNRTFRRSLVGCGEVRRPARYAGLDLLTVLTVDLDKWLFNVDRDAVMAGAETVYASERSLVVASRRYIAGFDRPADVPETMTTQIHRFDTSEAGETTYAASGSVPGFVLNQFSISEHERALRVATTEDPLWLDGAPQRDSESGVSVLRQDGSRLVTSGRAGGLGKGERIYAVRFLGERGYVVTFRQVDPLYVLDLRDPAAPKVTGELKIAGYSAYLHPAGEDLLIGVGQDATEQGVRAGGQVSLFDVSDPAAPRRLQQRAFGSGSSSEVEWDHLAFLWWEPAKLAMLPLQQYGPDPAAAFTGAVGLRVERTGITEAGRVTHGNDPYPALVRRSFVAGGRVITVSDRGLAASRVDTLAPLGFAAFPPAG